MKNRKYFFSLVILWFVVLSTSIMWNIRAVDKNMVTTIGSIGRSFFKEIETARLWNARHGGIYVQITEDTRPNPYLEVANRDISTTEGLQFTKVNPAFMTRQIAEIAKAQSDIQYHLTSLQPIRPENKAVEWEIKALRRFGAGDKEFFEFDQDTVEYRYMAPLPVKKACLKCHAKQGYRLGDIRGGISVTIPAKVYIDTSQALKNNLKIIHMIALVLGIAVFLFFKRSQDRQELKDKKNFKLEQAKIAAELANKIKSEFLANMGHEFRTPINGIIASAEIALKLELSPKLKKTQKTIRNSGYAILNTVNAILDFSKSETGRFELSAIPFRMDEVLGNLSEGFVQKSVERHIKISFDIDGDEIPNALVGDPDCLLKIFNHLLDNAAKFCTRIPTAVIGVRDVDTSARKTTLKFYVKDNGIGISSENFEKIFDTFTQLDDSRTRQYDGAGMGLSVSKRLVEQMGGTILVESELGKGSIFSFTVSFDRQDQEHPFKEPPVKGREDTTDTRVTSKSCDKIGNSEILLELLLKIDPFIQKRKPKQCKEIMEEINSFSWPDEYTRDIAELDRLISRYKFKDAQPVLASLIKILKELETP
jgi:signal transduction histidine kinase